jgi:hypothetical protein
MTLRSETDRQIQRTGIKREWWSGFDTYKRDPGADFSQAAIAEQTKAFLAAGGQIKHLAMGETGLNDQSASMQAHSLRTAAGLITSKKKRVEIVIQRWHRQGTTYA